MGLPSVTSSELRARDRFVFLSRGESGTRGAGGGRELRGRGSLLRDTLAPGKNSEPEATIFKGKLRHPGNMYENRTSFH